MDGYALFDADSDRAIGRVGAWPTFAKASNAGSQDAAASPCEIVLNECFGDDFMGMRGDVEVSSVMKRVAFERPTCGDCMIVQLVASSGKAGLEAFLPGEESKGLDVASNEVTAIGLEKEWRTVEFASKSASPRSLRQQVSSLLTAASNEAVLTS